MEIIDEIHPELCEAAKEINEVLKRHDLMGLICLSNQNRSSYFTRVNATWSCAELERGEGGSVGFRVKTLALPRAKRKEYFESTVKGMAGIVHSAYGVIECLTNMLVVLQERFQFKFTDHRRSEADLKQDEGN